MNVLLPRESAAFIAKMARSVKIIPEKIAHASSQIVKALESGEFSPSNLMLHSYPHPCTATESSVEWLFVIDTLNFSFWAPNNQHYSIEHKGEKYTGYMALCAAVTRALEEGIPITSADYYAKISEEDIKKIFTSSTGEPIPLAAERLKNLQESGRVLLDKFSGSFTNCVKQSNHSAENLLKIITENFPSFRDEAEFEGKRVSLYKRAQILIADIWGTFQGEGLGHFDDIGVLTMFADYRVPQVLIHFGVLEYSEELLEKLQRDGVFENGERDEVEIRGCSIHAVELIRENLQTLDLSKYSTNELQLNSAMIDFFLWDYRRKNADALSHIPFHKVRCIYY